MKISVVGGLVLWAGVACAASADERVVQRFDAASHKPGCLIFFGDGDTQEVLKICPNGSVEWHGDQRQVARDFWRIIAKIYPEACPGAKPIHD